MAHLRTDTVAVYVIRQTDDGPQLLQLRRVPDDDAFPSTWQTIYGHVQAGEHAADAARRELHEETGFTPARFFQVEFIETIYARDDDSVCLVPVFGAEVACTAVPVLNGEHDAFRWVAVPDVDTCFLWRSQREAVWALLDGLTRAGLALKLLEIS